MQNIPATKHLEMQDEKCNADLNSEDRKKKSQ